MIYGNPKDEKSLINLSVYQFNANTVSPANWTYAEAYWEINHRKEDSTRARAAHDDVLAPEYLKKCVAVLDEDSSVVLCHSITGRIDEHGILRGIYNKGKLKRIGSAKPHERFGDLIGLSHYCCSVMGVVRASSFGKTPLQGNYIGSDRNLQAEIGLMGRIHEIPECLSFQRDHPNSCSSTRS